MPTSPSRCPTCFRKHRRSNPQNARYWLLLTMISEKLPVQGVTYSAEQFHIYFKSRFLGCDDVTLPNGKVIPMPKSSADLDINQFAEFMDKVEAWAAEHGVFLEDMEGAV